MRGVALYLLGHNAFRLRDVGSVPRPVATVAALALIPVAVRTRPWSPGDAAGILAALAAYEAARHWPFGRKLRGAP